MTVQDFGHTGLTSNPFVPPKYDTSSHQPTLDSRIYMQTTRRSLDENEVHLKRPGNGVEDAATRNNEPRLTVDFPTPRSEA